MLLRVRTPMRRWRCLLGGVIALVLTASCPGWLAAQEGTSHGSAVTLDMASVTCGDLLAMSEDDALTMLTWMKGYYSGTRRETTWNLGESAARGRHLLDLCRADKSKTVMSTIERNQ
jgi:hypothetical protein